MRLHNPVVYMPGGMRKDIWCNPGAPRSPAEKRANQAAKKNRRFVKLLAKQALMSPNYLQFNLPV